MAKDTKDVSQIRMLAPNWAFKTYYYNSQVQDWYSVSVSGYSFYLLQQEPKNNLLFNSFIGAWVQASPINAS